MKKPSIFHRLFATASRPTSYKERLQADLCKCYTIQDWLLLRELLRYHVDAFTTEEFVAFVETLNGRLELLQYIDTNLTARYYVIGEIITKTRQANTTGLFAIKLLMEKRRVQYTDNQYNLFAHAFLARQAQLIGNVGHHFE